MKIGRGCGSERKKLRKRIKTESPKIAFLNKVLALIYLCAILNKVTNIHQRVKVT